MRLRTLMPVVLALALLPAQVAAQDSPDPRSPWELGAGMGVAANQPSDAFGCMSNPLAAVSADASYRVRSRVRLRLSGTAHGDVAGTNCLLANTAGSRGDTRCGSRASRSRRPPFEGSLRRGRWGRSASISSRPRAGFGARASGIRWPGWGSPHRSEEFRSDWRRSVRPSRCPSIQSRRRGIGFERTTPGFPSPFRSASAGCRSRQGSMRIHGPTALTSGSADKFAP